MSLQPAMGVHTSKDHVDIVLDAEQEIGLVLLGEGGQIDIGVGQVDTLAGRDETIVARLNLDGLVVDNLEHIERQDTVVDVNNSAWGDDLGDVLVVDVPGAVSV